MKTKKLLAFLLAFSLMLPTVSVSAKEYESTPNQTEISDEYIATEEPIADEFVTDEPVTDEPITDELIPDQPVIDEPVTDEPVIDKPITDEPITDEPVIDEPITDEPVIDEPVIDEPVIDEPVIDEPVIDEPVIDEPVIDEPVIDKPVIDEPEAEEPPRNSIMPMANEGNDLIPMATVASGSCGSNLKWTLDSTGTLTISGTGTMTDFPTYTDTPWYSRRASIKTVSIQSGVTTIGQLAFSWCENLTSVTIPNSVTSIGDHAFLECINLPSIKIPSSVTYIGESAFYHCNGLLSVNLPYGVKRIYEETFWGCSSLTSVTIPNSVTAIDESAFAACYGLTSLTIPDSVLYIYKDAFNNCRNLKSVTISKNISYIDYCAFYWTNLKTIIFKGNAPTIKSDSFKSITATAYYPTNNNTWTDDTKKNYGGTLTWKPWTCEMIDQEHSIVTKTAVPPTCTETGLTEGKHCSICGEILTEQTIVPAKGHVYTAEEFLWSDDLSSATASLICSCGHSEESTCSFIWDNSQPLIPTVTATAESNGQTFSDSKTITAVANGDTLTVTLPTDASDIRIIAAAYNNDRKMTACINPENISNVFTTDIIGDTIHIFFTTTKYQPISPIMIV